MCNITKIITQVIENKQWQGVRESLGISSKCTNAANSLKKHYQNYLEEYEQFDYFKIPVESIVINKKEPKKRKSKEMEDSDDSEEEEEEDFVEENEMKKENKEERKNKHKKEKVYCICKKPAGNYMIECEICKEWFHFKCVGIPITQYKTYEKTNYRCEECKKKTEEEQEEMKEKGSKMNYTPKKKRKYEIKFTRETENNELFTIYEKEEEDKIIEITINEATKEEKFTIKIENTSKIMDLKKEISKTKEYNESRIKLFIFNEELKNDTTLKENKIKNNHKIQLFLKKLIKCGKFF
jgi:hypothetical protein